jgi:hypothetical protein
MRRPLTVPLLTLAAFLLLAGCGGKSYDAALQGANVNYGEVLDGFMKRAQQAMSQVRDMPSAQAAADELTLINQDLDDLVYNAPRLSQEGQIELGKLAADHLTEVQQLKGQIDRSPALADVFDTQLSTMMGYLQTMVSGNYQDTPVP